MCKYLVSLLLIGVTTSSVALANDDVVVRTEKGQIAASDINTLVLDASIGEYDITATNGNTIVWQLDLVADADLEQARSKAEQFTVSAQREGDEYVLSVDWPTDTDNNGDINIDDSVTERWTISVPARLALDMNANIGEVTIDGVAGGVTLDFNIGEVSVEIPRGTVDISSNIGEVELVTRTDSLGDVDLDANIGEISFTNAGEDVAADYNFPVGQELHLNNDGEDSIEIGLNIGEIDVEVEQ
ncbi:MAG TPA: hypothetical protein VFP95_04875 [Gammaproteobacteria bacterium]|nr:hypothetical protein [Gammaproteobacteria bacterium]